MVDIAKRGGIRIRNENGRFNSGYCMLHEEKILLFNRNTTLETKSSVLARCLIDHDVEGIYIKPAIREFIEKEKNNFKPEQNFNLEIEF